MAGDRVVGQHLLHMDEQIHRSYWKSASVCCAMGTKHERWVSVLGGQLVMEKEGRRGQASGAGASAQRGGGSPALPGGRPVRPTRAPDDLSHSPVCLLASLLALGRGCTYPDLRHTVEQARSPLLCPGPHPDLDLPNQRVGPHQDQ